MIRAITKPDAPDRYLDRVFRNKVRPIIDRALGRKVLKNRPSSAQLGKLQKRFEKGPR
jgi:hypothetical protein